MRIRTYVIGRHPDCDIVVNDPTVSRYHAEMVQGTDGRFYLTDRASASGTWHRTGENWVRIRQSFILPEEPIMLGRFTTCTKTQQHQKPPTPNNTPDQTTTKKKPQMRAIKKSQMPCRGLRLTG